MKLKDNFSLFLSAMAALCLEAAVFLTYSAGKEAEGWPFHTGAFLLRGQVIVLAVCALVYVGASRLLAPLESILEGIALYGQGRFKHRIARSNIRELDLVALRLNGMAAKLAELDTLKDDLVANVSHELRSPLAAMAEYVDLLLADTEISGCGRENLARIQSNLARLGRLVENLLEMSKLEAGKLSPRSEALSAAEVVKDVCELFAPRISSRGLSLELAVDPALPEVSADRDKVKQILTNLVDNAVKYNRRGGTVRVSASADARELRITVQDTGGGIAPGRMEELFQRFRRLPGANGAAKAGGVGLGLAISRGLARAMGGDLTAESEAGSGSAFTCRLPLARKA